jgi:hypothetical protein
MDDLGIRFPRHASYHDATPVMRESSLPSLSSAVPSLPAMCRLQERSLHDKKTKHRTSTWESQNQDLEEERHKACSEAQADWVCTRVQEKGCRAFIDAEHRTMSSGILCRKRIIACSTLKISGFGATDTSSGS